MEFSVEKVNSSSIKDMTDFLQKQENYSLFLLGNFAEQGPDLSLAPNSANFKLIRRSKEVVCVFALTRRGNLLIQSTIQKPIFDLVLDSCLQELLPITGLLGEWEFCRRFWNFLKKKQVIQNELFTMKQLLYSLNLKNTSSKKPPNVRCLVEDDYKVWRPLRIAYLEEEKLPNDLTEEQLLEQFRQKTKEKIMWGLFCKKKLVSIAELNAKASHLGQVGGVYTEPAFRQKWYAKSVMEQMMLDAKKDHHLQKLLIFTGETNIPARKLYESLGSVHIGHFALLFGK